MSKILGAVQILIIYLSNILFNSVATNSTCGPIITCTVSFEGFKTPGTNFLISPSLTLALSLTFNLSLVVQLSTSTILSAPLLLLETHLSFQE